MDLKSLDEIEFQLIWLDAEISRHEIGLSTPGQLQYNPEVDRNRYAGCLAEREFLLKLKNRVLSRERKLDDSGGGDAGGA